MRVIAGSKRGLNLKAPEGMSTRPTTDRIKETLFNMIAFDLADCSFLDLFAGSGQMGIEALSRGAREAVFVEKDRSAFLVLSDNITRAGFTDKAQLMQEDVFLALKKLANHKPFDFIFMDPPYNHGLEADILSQLTGSGMVDDYTTIIVEASLDTDFSYVESLGYSINRIKTYKTNKHIFIKKA